MPTHDVLLWHFCHVVNGRFTWSYVLLLIPIVTVVACTECPGTYLPMHSQSYIKGYISHQHQKLVVSKQNPFPKVTQEVSLK